MRLELAGSGGGGDAGPQAHERLEAMLGIHASGHRQVDFRVVPGEAGTDNADHGVLVLIELERFAEHVWDRKRSAISKTGS